MSDSSYIYFGGAVAYCPTKTDVEVFNCSPVAKINWSCYGEVSIEKAKQFLVELSDAIKYAENYMSEGGCMTHERYMKCEQRICDMTKIDVTKYRKKPVVIEAVQFDGTQQSCDEISNWMVSHGAPSISEPIGNIAVSGTAICFIKTLEGTMMASEGDWIIRGVNGEFYPCKPDIFEMTYEVCNDKD